MSAPQSSLLLSLPEEVLAHIATFVDDSSILPFASTCRQLRRITTSPLLMRWRCLGRWSLWESKHDIASKRNTRRPGDVDWYSLFRERYHADKATLEYLDRIIEYPMDHILLFNRIVDFGRDALDILSSQASVGEEAEDVLARQWHSTDAIRYINRRSALRIFRQLRHDDSSVPMETALGALELFCQETPTPDLSSLSADLDSLATTFTLETPAFPTLSNQEKAQSLIRWMWRNNFHGCSAERYRALKNVFIGMTLRTVHTAIPITLVAILHALARRVGLVIHAAAFPGMVYARVDSEDGTPCFYDIFNVNLDTNGLATDQQLLDHAAIAGEGTLRHFKRPAQTLDLVVRMARNILHTLQVATVQRLMANQGYPQVNEQTVLYAALTALVVLPGDWASPQVIQHLSQQIPEQFPMDVRFMEEELLPRVEDPANARVLADICNALRTEDSEQKPVSPRTDQDQLPEEQRVQVRSSQGRVGRGRGWIEPSYYVGTVFRHVRHKYVAAIFGWTTSCTPVAGEEWIEHMKVNELPRGRRQPFYHVLVSDGSHRYVAEENIVPFKPREEDLRDLMKLAGRYFKRFDKERGVFVSNVKWEYPDD